jgi:hypothetical protein
MNCPSGQGYLMARPLSVHDAREYLLASVTRLADEIRAPREPRPITHLTPRRATRLQPSSSDENARIDSVLATGTDGQ